MGLSEDGYGIRILRRGVEIGRRRVRASSLTIGRGHRCDLSIEDTDVSREHVRLEVGADHALRVQDLGSRNGTFIAGQRIDAETVQADLVVYLGTRIGIAIEFSPDFDTDEGPVVAGTDAPTEAPGGGRGSTDDEKVVCPHCWHGFALEEILAVARHQDMVGDPVLGPEAARRFLPSRFTPEGHAIDAHGLACPDVACPRCHLVVPHPLTERRPVFLSVIGAPGSGKSYLLTSMAWELRTLLPREFAFAFRDADATCNDVVNDYERTLFMCSDHEALVALEKTEMQGRMYSQVRLDDMTVNLPRPLMFSLVPQPHHVWHKEKRQALRRTLVMYDNAGEHFEPGMDSAANPGTQHLARSEGLFFLFDPTKDARFRALCSSDDPQLRRGAPAERQEILLNEAITRISRYGKTWRQLKYRQPLIVVVTKFDIWRSLLKEPLPRPWQRVHGRDTASLDMDAVMTTSYALRHLLGEVCPEAVATAEELTPKVVYVPVSALGGSPRVDPASPESGALLVRPRDIEPIWATVPMMTMLAFLGLVPTASRRPDKQLPRATDCQASGDRLFLTVPGTEQRLEVPEVYLGRPMRCPVTGTRFQLPPASELRKQDDG